MDSSSSALAASADGCPPFGLTLVRFAPAQAPKAATITPCRIGLLTGVPGASAGAIALQEEQIRVTRQCGALWLPLKF